MEKLIKLSLSDIDTIYEETGNDGNVDFALARLKFMGTSVDSTENSQGYLLNESVLKEYANTALSKLITGKINKYSKDLMSHEKEPSIFGYIPPNSKITFEEENGRWFAICEAVISKIYCGDVIKAFKFDNDRCVSIEASIQTSPNNPKEIISFNIHSITILSKIIKGAVRGANMEIVEFSSEKAKKYYDEHSEEPLRKFAIDRKSKMNKNNDDTLIGIGLYKEINEGGKMIKQEDKEEKVEPKNDDIIMGEDKKEKVIKEEETPIVKEEKVKDDEEKEVKESEDVKDEKKATWSIDIEEVKKSLLENPMKETVLGLFGDGSMSELVSNLAKFAEEKIGLEKEKENSDKEKANVKFSKIMGMAKLKLDNGKYDEFYKVGKVLKFSELDSFEKDVKAFICDTVLFSNTLEDNPNLSYGTHLKNPATKNDSLWD